LLVARNQQSSDTPKHYLYALVVVFAINALSAILFMLVVNHPVFDGGSNLHDVHAYVVHGISVASIHAQHNPPGPLSFIWMAIAVRLTGHYELLTAGMAVLFSWFLLVAGTIIAGRYSQWPQLWYSAALSALIFPHSMTAIATILTEGPGILFALLGVLFWTEAASRLNRISSSSLTWLIVGGLFIGLSITSRQYYLALLPSAGVLALLLLKSRPSGDKLQWFGGIAVSLVVAVMPVILLLLIWKGISSPGMEAGTADPNYQVGVGLAWLRPIQVIFYTALYLVPYSFPAMWGMSLTRRWPALLGASAAGLAATFFRNSLVNPGPLNSVIETASRIPAGATLIFWLIASVTFYNAIAVGFLLWEERAGLRLCVPAIMALLVIFFFIAEQLGVGGNIPFYDRYILQLAPFLGLIGFWLFPKFTRPRILVIAAMSVFSQGMLWRYFFTG
jgi:hypothetical protein